MNSRGGSMLLSVFLAIACVDAFKFGKAEPDDDKRRGGNAQAMLSRLYAAAKERADRIRHADGSTTAPMKGEDMLSSLIDYARDKIKKPPLRSVERNFIKLKQDVQDIAEELRQMRDILALQIGTQATVNPQRSNYTTRQKAACAPIALGSGDAVQRQHDACVCRDPDTDLLACLAARQADRYISTDPTKLAGKLHRNKLEPVQGSKYTEL